MGLFEKIERKIHQPLFGHTMFAAKAISALGAGLIGGGIGLGAGQMFGGGSKKVKIPPQISGSLQWLYDLLQSAAPTMPTQQVAGMTPTEQAGQGILADFAGAGMPEGYTAGMGELKKIISGEYDPRTSPYYQGLRELSEREEEASVGRLARGQQRRGMFTGTPCGRAGSQNEGRFFYGQATLARWSFGE